MRFIKLVLTLYPTHVMARLHIDLHAIPVDMAPAALQLLIDNGFIKQSIRDIRYNDLPTKKKFFPTDCAFFEVKSYH